MKCKLSSREYSRPDSERVRSEREPPSGERVRLERVRLIFGLGEQSGRLLRRRRAVVAVHSGTVALARTARIVLELRDIDPSA